MSTVFPRAEQIVVLENIRWATYVGILQQAQHRRGRIAYDQGVLEIMSPSKLHERIKRLIGRMAEAFTEELEIEIESASSVTLKREDLQQGLEPDECYYLRHAAVVRGKDEVDLMVDPPPDLVIEVDITRASLKKFGMYAAMLIPEVWRCDGDRLRASCLQGDDYAEVTESTVLPRLPIEKLQHFLSQYRSLGESQLIRAFRAWVRERSSRRRPPDGRS